MNLSVLILFLCNLYCGNGFGRHQCEFHLYIKPFAGSGRAVIGCASAAPRSKVKGAGSGTPPTRWLQRGNAAPGSADTFAIVGAIAICAGVYRCALLTSRRLIYVLMN
ncbi:unnamed protein product [Colias eurytheme]|nr:unnamed protein product [Colias eurytheme]